VTGPPLLQTADARNRGPAEHRTTGFVALLALAVVATAVSTAVGRDASPLADRAFERGSEMSSEGLDPPQQLVLPVASDGEGRRWSADAEPVVLQAREIGSVSAQTVALLMSGQRGGEIAGSLIWTMRPQPADAGSFEVLIFVDADGQSLLDEHPNGQLDVGFFAYVFSDEGSLVAHLAEGLSLDLRTYKELLLGRGLKFVGRFSLPQGAYFVRLLVRNQNSGRVFLTQTRIDVPGDQSEEWFLLPPLFQEPRAGWIVTRQSNLATEEVGVELGEEKVLPASRVVVETRAHTALFLGGAGWNERALMTARITDSQGRQLAEPVLSIDRQAGFGNGVIRFFHATLGPLDLPQGFYTLEVMLDDEATGSRLSRYIPLAVVVKRDRLELRAALPDATADLAPRSDAGGAPAPDLGNGEFAAKYVNALYLLGEGDWDGARDAVVELESAALGSGGRRELAMIARIERQIVSELVTTDPGVLRPISLLHRAVFRQHLAFGEDRLADNAWPLAAELAEKVSDGQRLGNSPGFTQTLLVSLAADLVRATAVISAIDLLNRAVEIAPGDPSALLALGATYERSGAYEEAVLPLRRLVREHPDNAEGELRLAINLAREGKTEEAVTRFQDLIKDTAPTWIKVIAYQELARLVAASDAEPVLKEGVKRFPGNQALQVQLAFLLDNLGRAAEAAAVVEEICLRANAPETSPRVRYPAWPSLGLEGKIIVLEREMESLLPALVTALDARAPLGIAEDAT
jgi:Flp pilus assembly protein TadD